MPLLCPACQTPLDVDPASSSDQATCGHCGRVVRRGENDTETFAYDSSLQAAAFDVAQVKGDDVDRSRGVNIGDYEILGEIGRGGMGVVYRARQKSLDRVVALKTIKTGALADSIEVRRFRGEAEAAAQLDHPHITPIYEVGEYAGRHYFSMGLVEGRSLKQEIAEGPLPPRRAAEVVRKIALAVDYAHQRGVIHRDLKPSNVLLDKDGEPRVTDFGLAKRIERDSDLTLTGQVVGTPAYMSPEQAAGEIPRVGPRSDVYSLGVLLYELLTGETPFRGNAAMILQQALHDDPQPPRRLNDRISRDLEAICLKAMAREPKHRYASARELADDLERFLGNEAVRARPTNWASRFSLWRRRPERIRDASTVMVALSVMLALWEAQSLFFLSIGQLQVGSPLAAGLVIVGGIIFFTVLAGLGWLARTRTLAALWLGLLASFLLLLFAAACLAGILAIEGLDEKPVRIPVFGFFLVAALVAVLVHCVSLEAFYANRDTMRWSRGGGRQMQQNA